MRSSDWSSYVCSSDLAVGLWPNGRRRLRALAWLGAAAALVSFGLSGHVVTAGPSWLTVPVLIVHTSAVAFWAGALVPLWQAVSQLDAAAAPLVRSEEHTSELQSLMRISYAVFCLTQNTNNTNLGSIHYSHKQSTRTTNTIIAQH